MQCYADVINPFILEWLSPWRIWIDLLVLDSYVKSNWTWFLVVVWLIDLKCSKPWCVRTRWCFQKCICKFLSHLLAFHSGKQWSRDKWLSVFHHLQPVWLVGRKACCFWWVKPSKTSFNFLTFPFFFSLSDLSMSVSGKLIDGLLTMRKIEVKSLSVCHRQSRILWQE